MGIGAQYAINKMHSVRPPTDWTDPTNQVIFACSLAVILTLLVLAVHLFRHAKNPQIS